MVIRRKLKKSKKSAQITIENNSYDFPIYESTIGENVIDITKLHELTNFFTYDPGFK